jgi:phosphate-selective porin OprO and OprP
MHIVHLSKKSLRYTALGIALMVPTAQQASANSDAASAEQIQKLVNTIDRLEQRLHALERQQAQDQAKIVALMEAQAPKNLLTQRASEPKGSAEPAKEIAQVNATAKGFSIQSGDFELKTKALVQFDYRYFLDDQNPAQNDTFLFRRVRPSFEGSLGSLLGFRLTPEFAGDQASVIDAYIDLRFSPSATVRAGKIKGPVGQERLQSAHYLLMAERSFATELVPNRDLGLQLQGDLLDKRLNYTLGLFNGSPDGRDAPTVDLDDGKEWAARLFFEPYKASEHWLQGLGFGLAVSHGDKTQGQNSAASSNAFLPRYRSQAQAVVFQMRGASTSAAQQSSGVFADGMHRRISPQLYYFNGGFGLMAEAVRSEQTLAIVQTQAGTAQRQSLLAENRAYNLTASYLLTGEETGFRGITQINRPFAASGDGWGAWELVMRYGRVNIDDRLFPVYANPATAVSGYTGLAFGLNWYLTSNVKGIFNYTNTQFDGGAPIGEREREKTIMTRLQLSY